MIFKSIVLFASACVAWDSQGHKTVAKITSGLLSRKAARFVKDHLDDSRGKRSRLTHIEYALITNAAWADLHAETLRTGELHYAYTVDGDCQPFKVERDCGYDRTGRCIVTAIGDMTARASSLTRSKAERADALRYLIHLMADLHHPLHLGFRADFGGNSIDVVVDGERTNLHEVWDSLLMRRVKAQGFNYRTLADTILPDAKYRIKDQFVKVNRAQGLASAIATETIMSLTCNEAYKQEGVWIKRMEVLSEAYLESRTETMKIQLGKAAVRLAQLLEAIATEYFEQQRIQAEPEPREPSASTGRFDALSLQFDADEVVYEVEDPFEPIDPEAVHDSEEEEMPEEVVAVQPVRRRAMRSPKQVASLIEDAQGEPSIGDFTLGDVVLIKRESLFYITAKQLVLSDTWIPLTVAVVRIRFVSETQSRRFLIDVEVFPSQLPPPVLMVIFLALGAKELTPSTDFQVANIGMDSGMRVSIDYFKALELSGSSKIAVGETSAEAVADMVIPRPTPEDINRLMGARAVTQNEYALAYLRSIIDDLFIYEIGPFFFVSAFHLIKNDYQNARFAVSRFGISQTSSLTPTVFTGIIDARIFDGPITLPLVDLLDSLRSRRSSKQNLQTILKKRPLILAAVGALSAYAALRYHPQALERLENHFLAIRNVALDEVRAAATRSKEEWILKPHAAGRT